MNKKREQYIVDKIRDAIFKRIQNGNSPTWSDMPKKIDEEKEQRVMRGVKYD